MEREIILMGLTLQLPQGEEWLAESKVGYVTAVEDWGKKKLNGVYLF